MTVSTAKFKEWVTGETGVEVEAHVTRLALEMKERGYEHYGAKALVEIVRWHSHLDGYEKDKDYKIPAIWTSLLARKIMQENPELDEFFRTAKLRSVVFDDYSETKQSEMF